MQIAIRERYGLSSVGIQCQRRDIGVPEHVELEQPLLGADPAIADDFRRERRAHSLDVQQASGQRAQTVIVSS
jgi:hypothetical protein